MEVSHYLKEAEVNNEGLMLVQINLAETSPEEIINHLKVMVPEWKQQLQAPEPPARDFRFGVSNLKKYSITTLSPSWTCCTGRRMKRSGLVCHN